MSDIPNVEILRRHLGSLSPEQIQELLSGSFADDPLPPHMTSRKHAENVAHAQAQAQAQAHVQAYARAQAHAQAHARAHAQAHAHAHTHAQHAHSYAHTHNMHTAHTHAAHGHANVPGSAQRGYDGVTLDDEDYYEDEDDEDFYEDDEEEVDAAALAGGYGGLGELNGTGRDNGYFYGEDPYGETTGYYPDYADLNVAAAAAAAAPAAPVEAPEVRARRVAGEAKEEGNAALRDGDTEAAVEHYTRAIAEWPHDPVFYSNRAAALIKLLRWSDAAADCESALALDATAPKPLFRLASCQLARAELSEARATLARLGGSVAKDSAVSKLAADIDDTAAALLEADKLLRAHDPARADEVLQRVGHRIEGTFPLRLLRARVLIGQKHYEPAQSLLLALSKQEQHSGNAELLLWRGVAFYHEGKDEVALRLFQEVLRTDPDNATAGAMFKLMRKLEATKKEANTLFKAGKAAAAVEAFSRALELDPRNDLYNAVIHGNRAAARMLLNEWHAAAEDCTRSLALKPDNAKLYARRARCWAGLSLLEDAVRDFERAHKLEPSETVEEELKVARVALKRSKQTSFYSLLEVSVTASADEIKRSYRKLALRWHPDRQTGGPTEVKNAEDKFKKITEAYEVLSDPSKKKKYDLGYELDEINSDAPAPARGRRGGGGFGGGYGRHDDNDLFNMFYQQQTQQRRRQGY